MPDSHSSDGPRSAGDRRRSGKPGGQGKGLGKGAGSRRTGGDAKGKRSQSGRGSAGASDSSARKGSVRKGSGHRDASSRAGDRGRSGADRAPGRDSGEKKQRRDLKGAAVNLPNWVVEEVSRVTAPERVAAALEALGEASAAFEEGRYHHAFRKAQRAKDLSPRDVTIRETLALSAYRVGDWQAALRELRTYRRLSGEVTHLPIEMDVLRAMERPEDVEKVWAELRRVGARPAVFKEGKVVYGSFLIDRGDPKAAWEVTKPHRISAEAREEDHRVWYVAARAAAQLGDAEAARRLRNAILEADPGFPGIDELEREIARAG